MQFSVIHKIATRRNFGGDGCCTSAGDTDSVFETPLAKMRKIRKLCNLQIRPYTEYCTHALAPVSTHKNWNIIVRLEGIEGRVTKMRKEIKDYSNRKRVEKLEIRNLLERRMRADLKASK